MAELGRRLWQEFQRDEILGRGAQLAYYFLLALFPALIFLTALMGLFPLQNAMPELMSYLQNVLPDDALSLVLGGIVTGVVAALIVGQAAASQIAGLLFGLKTTDPLTIAAAVAVLLFVALGASYFPARRASRVDPMVALRSE